MAVKLQPVHMPMIIPPKPWTGISEGGYLTNRCETRAACPGVLALGSVHCVCGCEAMDTR